MPKKTRPTDVIKDFGAPKSMDGFMTPTPQGWANILARSDPKRVAELLTKEEIESLRRGAKERSSYLRKAFAQLKPKEPKES